MSPFAKYSLARIGLLLAVAALLLVLPLPLSLLVRLGIAVLVAGALSFVLLRGLRERAAADLAGRSRRRAERKERLRRAMAGEDDAATDERENPS